MRPAPRLTNEHGREAFDPDIKKLFGLDPKAKWPASGMTPRVIQGVLCGVDMLYPGKFRIRTWGECPVCKRRMALGRLNQHFRHAHGAYVSPEDARKLLDELEAGLDDPITRAYGASEHVYQSFDEKLRKRGLTTDDLYAALPPEELDVDAAKAAGEEFERDLRNGVAP